MRGNWSDLGIWGSEDLGVDRFGGRGGERGGEWLPNNGLQIRPHFPKNTPLCAFKSCKTRQSHVLSFWDIENRWAVSYLGKSVSNGFYFPVVSIFRGFHLQPGGKFPENRGWQKTVEMLLCGRGKTTENPMEIPQKPTFPHVLKISFIPHHPLSTLSKNHEKSSHSLLS